MSNFLAFPRCCCILLLAAVLAGTQPERAMAICLGTTRVPGLRTLRRLTASRAVARYRRVKRWRP